MGILESKALALEVFPDGHYLAEKLGFEAIAVYVLPQKKGNSSQQMKKFGRQPLRKSITLWQKP
jgi:hypothetical protein